MVKVVINQSKSGENQWETMYHLHDKRNLVLWLAAYYGMADLEAVIFKWIVYSLLDNPFMSWLSKDFKNLVDVIFTHFNMWGTGRNETIKGYLL
jgi:hypothetical protein